MKITVLNKEKGKNTTTIKANLFNSRSRTNEHLKILSGIGIATQ